MNKWLRKDLAGFKPYHVEDLPCSIKLDANESPYNLPDSVRRKLMEWLSREENLNIYPDSDSTALRKALALFWNLATENIICGVGSDQIIDYITKAFLEPGDSVITLSPTFSMYKLSAMLNHGNIIEIPLKDNYSCPVYDIMNAANTSNAKVLFLCTPNNPTGNSISLKDVRAIAEAVQCLVVVDEAYADFSGQTIIPDLAHYPNLIVTRTFSKAFGLAGARVGYGIASEELIEALSIVKAPYNLSTISQMLAEWALTESAEFQKRAAMLMLEKDRLCQRLQNIPGLKLNPSDANFIFAGAPAKVFEALTNAGILVRRFEDGEKQKLRISIGTPEQNDQVYNIIKDCFLTNAM